MLNRVLAISIVLLFSASVATAQDRATKKACSTDVRAKCGKMTPGKNNIRRCVAENIKDFSDPCKAILAKSAKLWDACTLDIKKSCDGAPNIRMLQGCVKASLGEFSKPCQDAMAQSVSGNN